MAIAEKFTTPVGRLVQGDCFEPQTKNMQGQPLLDKHGQPTQKYFVAVAFKKTDAAFAAIKTQFESIARAAFPQFFPNGGPCTHPQFSMKIVDGDGVDNNGKPNNTKDGFAGHWILRASSSYPPQCYASGKFRPEEQLHCVNGVNPIPRGHFVRVAGSVSGNGGGNIAAGAAKPGLFVNVNMICWESIGDLITSGPDANEVFGNGAPRASGPVMLPAAGPTTYAAYIAAGWTDAALIASGYMAPPAAAPVAAPPPPAPGPTAVAQHPAILTGPVMLPAAGPTTYAAYIAAGWTDAALIASGYMAPPAAAPVAAPPPPAPPAPVAARSPQDRMLPAAGVQTYAAYIAAGWTEAQLIANAFMSAS